jgi:hypothetical protein
MADEPAAQAESGEATQETTQVATEVATETQPQETTQEAKPEPVKAEEPQEDWRDKEIKRKHAKLKEHERELERIRRENEDLRQLAQARAEGKEPPAAPKQPNVPQDEIQRQARALREQERYQEQLTSTNSAGETTYGDKWGKALDKLATFGTVDPADMTAILNTDNPAKVLFELGSNPAEYQRIMDLPPAKRLTEIVKISMKEAPKPAPNISKAPPPTESVSNRATPEVDLRSEKTSDSDWYAVRQKQKKERFEQMRAIGRA